MSAHLLSVIPIIVDRTTRGGQEVNAMEKAFLRISEVAEVIGAGKSLAYELVASGEIPSIWLAGRRSRRVPREALERWIAEQAKQADEVGSA
jgi:excisionase family DNA binding protein